jgi:uncharacterized membrane protein YhiD involved in acid resistance
VIGNGLFGLAVVSTLLVLLVLIVFDILEHAIPPVVYRSLSVAVAAEEHEKFERWCRERVSAAGMQIQETLLRIDSTQGRAELIFRVRVRGSKQAGRLIEEICERPGIRQVRWDQVPEGQR